jgi:NADH:ubiquinone oxidoreductase subunit E
MEENKERKRALSIEKIPSQLQSFERKRRNLIPMLQMVQQELAYIPPEAIQMVAEHLGFAAKSTEGHFHNQFRFNPPGKILSRGRHQMPC